MIDYIDNDYYYLGNLINIIGKGGLGYKPRIIKGGMAYTNPDKPSELYDEHILKFKNDERYKDLKIDTLNEYLEAVINSTEITDEKKIEELNKQLSDLEMLKEINKSKGKNKDKELERNINTSLSIINTYFKSDDNKEIEALENEYKQPENNDFYKRNQEEAKKKDYINNIDIERGNIFEGDITDYEDDTRILYNIDKDKSTAYNSKELEPYTNEFLKFSLERLGIKKDLKDLTEHDKIKLSRQILTYIPLDIIKDKTLWELKSYNTEISGNYDIYNKKKKITQDIQKSKMWASQIYDKVEKGKKPSFKPFDVVFKYNNVGNNDWRVENLYAIDVNDETKRPIPLLKNNNFKYYWLFGNPDVIGYYNPLLNKNFEPIKQNDGSYMFGWKGIEDIIDSSYIKIPNKDIQIYPRRYSTKFNKIINKHKNKKP